MASILNLITAGALFFLIVPQAASAQTKLDAQNPPRIERFMGRHPMTRVDRPFKVFATIHNPGTKAITVDVRMGTPAYIRIMENANADLEIAGRDSALMEWTITADKPLYDELRLEVSHGDAILAAARLPVRFLPAQQQTKLGYIPDPVIPKAGKDKILVGAHYYPGWDIPEINHWEQVYYKHLERIPALGFYNQEHVEVNDWETKWAVEHGIDFFIYCWYRTTQGGPITQRLASGLETRNLSKFKDLMPFTIMWENQRQDQWGVDDEADLLENVLPFWMENYFKQPNYLKVDNKPVLYIYRPENLINDLGSIENVRRAFDKLRQACIDEGFDGLWILGEYRYQDPKHLGVMKAIGLDYTFAYCWPVQNSPSPQQAIDAQLAQMRTISDHNIIPQVITVSQGWSGWQDERSIWAVPPTEFETLLRQAKAVVEAQPKVGLEGRMIILDNWNEWSEGHYLAPNTEYGFEYLDVIRKVFLGKGPDHVDLIPEDVGLGGYEDAFYEWVDKQPRR